MSVKRKRENYLLIFQYISACDKAARQWTWCLGNFSISQVFSNNSCFG